MKRFKVTIRGGDLDRAQAHLVKGGIGSSFAAPGGDALAAGVDAGSDVEARARVANALPEGDYRIEGVEPWPEEAS
jgi:hypothetical protein